MQEQEKKKSNSFIKDLVKDIVIAVIIVLAITAVIKPTIVNQTSMLDTLEENDYLLINKLAYMNKEHPNRGDIVVFESDLINPETGKEMLLIKRVIAVEGDMIAFYNDQVYLNGELLEEDYLYDEPPMYRDYPNGMEVKLETNEVFVMGDHRSASEDSRSTEIGKIPEDDILGKVFVRLYPFDKISLMK